MEGNGDRGRGARRGGNRERRPTPIRPAHLAVLLPGILPLLGILFAGCATPAPPPPPPAVDVEGPPDPDPAPEEEAARTPATEPHLAPTPPWLPARIRWTPDAPREGSALGVWVRTPPEGRRIAGVEGTLEGRPVRFQEAGEGWFGIAALPIGSAGRRLVTLRLRIGPDSVVERLATLRVAARSFPSTRLRVAPRFSRPSAEVLRRIEEERKRIRATLESATAGWLPDAPFAWPRPARITSPFGQRRVFNGELQSRHMGLDLRGDAGAPVRAAADGRVALVGHFFYQGNAVYLDHGLGTYTGYFHLSSIDVRQGQRVARGERLGAVGATGRVTGPHLHWSLYVDGQSLDPSSLLEMEVPGSPAGREEAATAGATP